MPQVEVNGQKMYIPQSGMKQFTQDFPDANIHYTVGKDTLSIPYKNSKAFLNDYPDATTIGDDTEQQSPTVPLAFEAPEQQNEKVSGVLKPKDVRALAPELEGKLDFTPQKTRSTNEFDGIETGVASPESIIKEKTINQDPYFITSQSISNGIERASKGQLDTYRKNDTKTYGAVANYMDAKNIYQEADDTMNAKGGLGSGMSDKAMDENTWFMGIPKIGELLKTKSLIDKLESGKQLTDDEDVLLDAVATLAQANLIKDKQTSAAYKGGAGIVEMVPFIAQMAMTGGLGKLALSGGEKALVRYLGGKIASKMGLRLAELGVKAASKVGQAAIGASISPMTAQGTLENMQGKIAPTIENNEIAYNKGVNEYGDAVGREDQMSAGEAYLDAFENTAKEFVTEMSGGSVGVLGKIATAVPGIEKLFAKVAQSGFGKVGKAIFANDYFKKAGIHGLLGEYNEEVDGALYDHIRGKENINKFFNWDSQAQLLYTLVPVSAFGGAMSLGAKIQGVSAFNKSDKNLTQLLRSEGYSNEDIETIKMGLLDATPQDAGNQLSAIISNMKNGVIEADGQRGINNELAQPFLDFMIQGQRQNAINQGLQSRKESFDNDVRTAATESIAQVDSTINPATGTIVMAEINGQPVPISGNAVFLEDGTLDIENSDETLSYKDEEGNVIPITAKELINAAQIDPIQARTEAVSAATSPIIQQQKNEDAPEFEVGEYVRHENGMLSGEITAKTDNGYMVKSLTQGEVEVQGGNLINDKHVSGLKSKEEVEYTENGETKVGIVDDIESGRSKGTVDLLVEVNGKQIPKTVNYDQIVGKKVEKEVESAEVSAGSTDKMIVEPSADEALSDKQSPEAVIPTTEDVVEPEIEPETKQEPEAPTEPEKTPTYNEQIPKKKVGKKTVTDYESVAPGITLGALREDFEDSDIKELVATKIKDIEKQIKAVGEVKKIADFDLYKANVKAAKEKVDNLNKQLEYWNSVKEEAKPKNKVEVAEIPIRESRDERYDRWGEPRSLRELILYHFVGGMKLRWNDIKTDDGKVLSRGMGAEYRYDNGERLTRIGLTSNDGLTPEQYADKLWGANGYEKGNFEEMDLSGEDTTSILNEIQYILNEYASTGQMIAAINEDRAQLSKEEQAYLDQAIFEADNNIDNLSDDIYAAVLGLTEFTEEQLNELNNILQNETNETTEGTSPTAIEETESIESDNEGKGSEGVVGVTLFKKGEGGTKGIFQDKDGNLYKSLIQTYLAFEDGVAVRKDAEGISKEYDILKALQGNPRVPIIGKKVETSEGAAFEIEKLDEVESLTFDEYEQIRDILNDLNNQGYFVNDTVTVMRRPTTGQLVIVDFSAGRYDKKLIGNSTFSDLSFTSRLRQMMSEADQKKANAKRDQEDIDLWSEIEAESAKKKADKELESLEAEYNSKSVEELVALKKQLYSDMDIESPKSAEEKLLEKVIADKFSDINKAVSEKRKAKKALESESAKQEQFNEQSRPSIDFNNWKWEKASSNAIVIRPNTVGKPFTDEQFNTLMEWGEKNNFTPIRNSRNTRIEFVVDKLDNELVDYLDSVSVKAINDKKAAEEKARKDEAEKAKKEELRNTVNLNPATSWINREFGEDAMNDYNKNALAKFLNGDTKTFEGQVNNKWADAIMRLNALTEDGKGVDFAKLKKAYEQSEAAEHEQISVEDIYEQSKPNIAIVNKKSTTQLQAYEIGHEIGMQIKNAGLSKEARTFIADKKDINRPLMVLPYFDGLYDGFKDKTDNKAQYEAEQEQIRESEKATVEKLVNENTIIAEDKKKQTVDRLNSVINKEIDNKYILKTIEYLSDPLNEQTRSIFAQITGIKLPATIKGSETTLREYVGLPAKEKLFLTKGEAKKVISENIGKNVFLQTGKRDWQDGRKSYPVNPSLVKIFSIDEKEVELSYDLESNEPTHTINIDNVRDVVVDGVSTIGDTKLEGIVKDLFPLQTRDQIISDIANKKIDAVEGVKKLDELKNNEARFSVADNFYSTVERALGKINQDKGTKAQFKAMLLNNGAKQAEMDWMGFDELPEKLTKGDVQAWIDENRIEVEEVEKAVKEESYYEFYNEDGDYMGTADTDKEAYDISRENGWTYEEIKRDAKDASKFSQYVLPGGENYKELLLTMPSAPEKTMGELEYMKFLNIGINEVSDFRSLTDERQNELMSDYRDYTQGIEESKQNAFKSSHFDEPNILAHIRFNERTVNGERVLFLEELQSDWQQTGKKKGFKGDYKNKSLVEPRFDGKYWYLHEKESGEMTSSQSFSTEAEAWKQVEGTMRLMDNGVANMPFKKTDQWVNLAARRMMRYAAENGFDRIAWTNGNQQADRYSLAKQVSEVFWWPKGNGEGFLRVTDNTPQKNSIYAETIPESKLEDVIGKEVAKKVLEAPVEEFPSGMRQSVSGEGLKVGGEGMKAFYDAIVPSAMSKLGKPFGAKVENIDLETGNQKLDAVKYDGTQDISNLPGNDYIEKGHWLIKDFDGNIIWSMDGMWSKSEAISKYKQYSAEAENNIVEGQGNVVVQSIPVTDSMKETAMAGFPLFKRSDKNEKATQARIEGVKGIIAQLNKDNGTDAIVADTNEEFIELVPAEYADYIRKHEIGGIFYSGDVIINAEMIESNDKVMSVYEHEYAHVATAANFTRKQLSELWNDVSDSDKALLPIAYRNESDYVKADELISHAVEDIIEKQGYENYKNGNIDLSLYSEPLQNKLKTVIENANRNYIRNVQKGNEGRNTNGNDNAKGASQDLFGATGNGQTPKLGQEDNGLSEQVKGALPATITINGVEKPTTNSLGKPIHSTEEGIRNFWKWFSDSKVTDEQGRPLVVYHGAMSQIMPKDTFKGYVSYFTDSKEYAETFGVPVNREVMLAYLKLENPYNAPSEIADVPKEIHDTDQYTNPRIIKSETDKFDGVIGIDAGQRNGKTFVVFSPTQIKLSGNDGTFDPDNADIRFAILGEKGAAALDAEEEATTRLDNLRVAKEMEKAKTAKEIRLATGWERNVADNLWRYEVPDNPITLKKITSTQGRGHLNYSANLEDLFVDKELLNAYPQLRQMKVLFQPHLSNRGEYDSASKTIKLKVGFREDGQLVDITIKDVQSTLIHEVQHAIQEIEGFAKGGNVESIRPEMLQYPMMIKKAQDKIDDYYQNHPDGIAIDKESDEWLESNINPTEEEYAEFEAKMKAKYPSVNSISQYTEIIKQQRKNPKTREEAYKRLAGEVEARNASTRMNMTEDERRAKLLSETADVAPEDQIILFNVVGGQNNSLSLQAPNVIDKTNENYKEYTTQSGEVISYVREQLELFPIDAPTANVQQQGTTTIEPYDSSLDESDDVTHFERLISEQKHIKLSGDTKIKSANDIAYLFRSLESAPVENVFAVLQNTTGTYKVLYLSSGATNASVVDLKLISAAVKEFGATGVTLVHNHPSGSLKTSPQDIDIQKRLKASLYGTAVVNPGIIINLDSGKYVEFDDNVEDINIRPEQSRTGKESNARVYAFDKQKLYTKSDNLFRIRSSTDVALALSRFKRGTGDKYIVIITDQQNRIVRTFLTTDISANNLIPLVGKHGENVFIGSNKKTDKSWIRVIQSDLSKVNIKLFDFVTIAQDPQILSNYYSYSVEGLLNEPTATYNNNVNDSGNLPTGENRDELDAKLNRALFGLNDRLASLSEVGEGWVDKWLPIKEMEDLMESKGVPITDATSYYRQSTHIAPRIMARQHLYQENVFKPLQRAISALMVKGVTYNEVEVYAMVKHGIEERNPYFNDKNETTDVDYSGVTAFEAKHGNLTDLIANFEAKVGDEALKEFWKQKKNNTDFSIDVEIEAGTITREFGNELKARWAHYMPLRGFEEITAAEKYEYNPSIGTYFSAPMKKIKGRTSEATMPFAYIQQMAHSSISKSQKNEAKKTIDKLERVDETGILKRGKSWYEYVGEVNGMKTFEAAEPTYSEDPQEFENNINEFEQRMQALRKEGKAYEKNDSAFDLGVAFIRPSEKEQHAVRVIVQGEEKVIYIMSNPRISRAINGTNVVHTGNVTGAFSAVNRWMAQNFTTRNPVFIATNAERDTLWSQFAVIAKEDATYLGQFEKNIAHSLNTLRKVMFGKAATNDKYAKYYQEYLINGAMTGFSQTLAIETIQKDIEKAIKKGENVSWSKALANYIDASNKMVENANRFAAYITSREQGRSIISSVNDAKELTVNWDRSGSGAMGNMETKAVVLFANAAIQGLNTSVKIAKVAPKVTTAVIAGLIISGLTNAMLVGLMGGDDAEEAYMNVSSIKRRDNYMIYSPTTGLFHNIALPQNLRVFHGFGSDLYLAMKGKADLRESFINLMNGVLDFLPMNPYESVSYLNSDGVKGFVGSVSSNVSVLYPVMQHALNRDYLNHTILNEWNDKVDMPGFMKARTNKRGETLAPAWLMWASEKLNDLGGGDRVTPGEIMGLKLSFNPDVANHYLRGYFGGMYNITQQAATTLYKTGEAGYKSLEKGELVAPDIKLRETPIGTFAVDPADIMQRNTTTNNKYFDIKTDIEERYRKRNEYNDEYSNDRAAKVVGTRKLEINRKTDEIKALIKTISEFEGRLNEKYPEWKKDKWQKDINDLKKKVINMHEKAPK